MFEACGRIDPALQPVADEAPREEGTEGQQAACLLHGEVGRPVERSEHPDARDVARAG